MTMQNWTPEDLAPADVGYWRGVIAGTLGTLGTLGAVAAGLAVLLVLV